MEKINIKNIEEITPFALKHLIPSIEQAVDVCRKSHWEDPSFNDKWTFGTHLWKNIWNRFEELASSDECPFKICGKKTEYKLKIGPFILRHHRIDQENTIPKAAKAAKASADMVQLSLFDKELLFDIEKENIIIAIVADVDTGLKEVFIGELERYSQEYKHYKWAKKAPVFLAKDTTSIADQYVKFIDDQKILEVVPEEKIPEINVVLDNSKASYKSLKKGGK